MRLRRSGLLLVFVLLCLSGSGSDRVLLLCRWVGLFVFQCRGLLRGFGSKVMPLAELCLYHVRPRRTVNLLY